ncbi:MAG: alpha/beta hydrolase [Planctomycetaceae bacterium]
MTIYASSKDIALKASSWVNLGGKRRLGDAGSELTLFPDIPNINMVDASDVDTSLFQLRHAYHADSPTILRDIQSVFNGWSTERRGLSSLYHNLAWKLRSSGKALQEAVETIVR